MTQIYVKRSNVRAIYVYGCSQKEAIELLNNYGYEPFSDEYHNKIMNTNEMIHNNMDNDVIKNEMKKQVFLKENKINEIGINNLYPFKSNKDEKKLPIEVSGSKWSIFNTEIVDGKTVYIFTDTYINTEEIDNLCDTKL